MEDPCRSSHSPVWPAVRSQLAGPVYSRRQASSHLVLHDFEPVCPELNVSHALKDIAGEHMQLVVVSR